MSIILFDNHSRNSLFPFTYTKAVADLRFGIYSIRERWEALCGQPVFVHTEPYLQTLYPVPPAVQHTWIDASIMITGELMDRILSMEPGCCLADENGLIAGVSDIAFEKFDAATSLAAFRDIEDHALVKRLEHPWQLMQWNDEMIRTDFARITKGKTSQPVPPSVQAIAAEN